MQVLSYFGSYIYSNYILPVLIVLPVRTSWGFCSRFCYLNESEPQAGTQMGVEGGGARFKGVKEEGGGQGRVGQEGTL